MLKFIIDILFPPVCVICRKEALHLCNRCLDAIKKDGLFSVNDENSGLDGLISVCVYRDKSIISKVIHCFKYEFIRELADILGILMSEALNNQNLKGEILLCPVPLHKKRERWRGYNQSRLLALKIGGKYGHEVKDLLTRIKYKRPQMELGKDERERNIIDSFKPIAGVSEKYSDRTVILVDDVHTTGATMRECAKALKEEGFRLVYGLVIAQTV